MNEWFYNMDENRSGDVDQAEWVSYMMRQTATWSEDAFFATQQALMKAARDAYAHGQVRPQQERINTASFGLTGAPII